MLCTHDISYWKKLYDITYAVIITIIIVFDNVCMTKHNWGMNEYVDDTTAYEIHPCNERKGQWSVDHEDGERAM